MIRVFLAVCVGGLLAGASALAAAAPAPKTPAPAPAKAASAKAAPAATSAEALAAKATAGVKKKPKIIDFEDETIRGTLTKPEGDIIGGRRRKKQRSLLKIRRHWVPELLKSADDL